MPGPWTVVDVSSEGMFAIVDSHDRTVAFTDLRADIVEARLIAAAPDLLSAAKIALDRAESWIHDQLDGTSSLSGALADLESVRAAIAKAEGQ